MARQVSDDDLDVPQVIRAALRVGGVQIDAVPYWQPQGAYGSEQGIEWHMAIDNRFVGIVSETVCRDLAKFALNAGADETFKMSRTMHIASTSTDSPTDTGVVIVTDSGIPVTTPAAPRVVEWTDPWPQPKPWKP